MKKIAIILAGLIFMVAGSAWALPFSLTVYQGDMNTTPIVVVEDNQSGDLSPVENFILFTGVISPQWWFNVSVGLFGELAGQGVPQMSLDATSLSSVTANPLDLIIKLSGTTSDLWSGPGGVVRVNGTSGNPGDATFETRVNTNTVSDLSFSNVKAFGATDPFPFASDVSDDIEMIATISHNDGRAYFTQFNYSLTPVPEPGTLILLGAGFFGLAIYSKRRLNNRIV